MFDTTFMPHGHCYFWQPGVLWLNVISDALIALAYYSIPIALVYFVRKRKDLAFNWIFILFAIFILACGTTHVIEIWNIWHAHYWFAGAVKAVTALASIVTAFLLWPLIPRAIKIPRMAALEEEIVQRKAAEAEIRSLNTSLEKRVLEATEEVSQALKESRAIQKELEKAEGLKSQLLRDEQAARSALENTNRVKDEFLATLSHELRTPLNAILGWSQLLNKKYSKNEDLSQGLRTIDRNARSQAQLIEDLLDISSIISGKVKMDPQKMEIQKVVQSAVESVKPTADAKEIILRVSVDPSVPVISADSSRMQQVIWNLLSNAIKFTPSGGTINVVVKNFGTHIKFSVADNGRGIAPDFLPYIFDRFRQADSSTTRRFGGLGIGLSIVKNLVELHGGTVSAASDGEGTGSTFDIEIPIYHVLSEPSVAASKERSFPTVPTSDLPPVSLAGIRVLAIDDEIDARVLLKRILEENDATVLIAGSAQEALKAIEDFRPHVILSDIGMPDHDGYELIQSVRTLPNRIGETIPAVALTAFARNEDRIKALAAGFSAHLSKPVEPAHLVATVKALSSTSVDSTTSNPSLDGKRPTE